MGEQMIMCSHPSAPNTVTPPNTQHYMGPSLTGRGTDQREGTARDTLMPPIAACNHPAICCEQHEDQNVAIEDRNMELCV